MLIKKHTQLEVPENLKLSDAFYKEKIGMNDDMLYIFRNRKLPAEKIDFKYYVTDKFGRPTESYIIDFAEYKDYKELAKLLPEMKF